MGPKKDTLLRWVNCCFESEAPVDNIRSLSDGGFFLHILGFLRSHFTTNSAPWLQIVTILKDHNVTDEIIDFDGAASGSEEELARLIVVCMHLTMVQKPCEMIKERTMLNLSTEDQKVLESILTALVNDDTVTRSRLTEVLQDYGHESSHSKPMTFYTSSPLSSMPRNSPLKRFLDSPMALRLSRLQREINDKNEEIRRLQTEIISESDESSALRQQMEELNRRVKEMEKRNAELTQRLRDCQIPESSLPGVDVEINQLKKQLKKLQSEYELSCQKYCDLNLEHEALKLRQEKDRKQIRQLQIELNEAVARFERESAEYQLLLDSIRTENVELKHTLEEKSQWIDVLEERNRNCSEHHSSRLMSTPKSPCERESIGFSLLSIETEKLQFEVDTYRREIVAQASNFQAERQQYQQHVGSLQEEKAQLSRQVEETSSANAVLNTELQGAKICVEQLTEGCNTLRQEKDNLLVSLESLNAEFQQAMERAQHQLNVRVTEAQQLSLRIDSLNGQLEETVEQKTVLQRSVESLEKEKQEICEKLASVREANQSLEATLAEKEEVYKRQMGEASSKIQDLQGKTLDLENTTSHLEQERNNLLLEKENLEAEVRDLRSEIDRSTKDFQARIDSANSNLEEASSRIANLTSSTSLLRNQLDEAMKEKAHFEKLSADLEAQRAQLLAEREALQQEVAKLLASAQLSRDEFVSEKNQLLEELDMKKTEIADKLSTIHAAEQRHEEAIGQIERLECRVHTLESDMKELLDSKNHFEQQAKFLQAEIEEHKNRLEVIQNKAKEKAEDYESLINQRNADIQALESQLQTVCREKKDVEEQVVLLGNLSNAHQQQIACLRQAGDAIQTVKRELETELVSLQKESQKTQDEQQVIIREQSDKISSLEEKLLQSVQHQNDLTSRLSEVSDEKCRLIHKKDSLNAEVARIAALLDQERAAFEDSLTAMKYELEVKQTVIEESNQKISAIESELAEVIAQKGSLENQVQLLVDERRNLLEQQTTLEEDNRQLGSSNKEQLEEQKNLIQRLSVEHESRLQELSKQLEEAQQRSSDLSSKCAKLEFEREALSFEKNNFEQMYLELKIACEEAEAKILMEGEVARRDAEARESKLQQQSEALNALQEVLNNLRLEKDVAESTKVQRINDLEAELGAMQDERDRLEQERSALAVSSEVALRELNDRFNSVGLTVEQLSSEIKELTQNKIKLENRCECLESEKAAAEEEIAQFQEDLETKDLQIIKLSEKIKCIEHELAQAKQENHSLHVRITDLEAKKHDTARTLEEQLHEYQLTLEHSASELKAEKEKAAKAQANFIQAMSDLRSLNDGNRREFEVVISGLKRELEAEQQKSSKQASTIQELESARQEMNELVESLQRQLTELEGEKEALDQAKAKLEESNARLEKLNDSQRTEFEREKSDLQSSLVSQERKVDELNDKLVDNVKLYDGLKSEYERLKDAHEKSILQEKTSSDELQKQVSNLESQVTSKASEISQLSEFVETLKHELEKAKKQTNVANDELCGQLATLTLERENLQKKLVAFEQENRQLKAERAVEKDKFLHAKSELVLEHRKEKAALEARYQLAQSQVKSMQEKLVNMTVANNSHAPLEHKVSLLTSELETIAKAKEDLEKQLKEALERANKTGIGNDQDAKQMVDPEFDALRIKYEAMKKTLAHKEEVISQYARNFEKIQAQLEGHDEQVSTLNAENRKLTYENRTLKTEQQHLLAQMAAEKDKANAKASRLSLALQRGLATSDGGTLADAMIDARRRTLRSTKSEVVSTNGRRSPEVEVFRPPSLAFGDGSDASSIFKVPPSRRDSFNRRESVNSVCSTRSDASTASRLPHGAGRFFTCDDEDGEQFSNLYLNEMKEGKCKIEETNARLSELHRRNTMQPPHMRSAYPAEMNDERLRCAELSMVEPKTENLNDSVGQLSEATSMLSVHTPPAMNTRKRRSSSWNTSEVETPVLKPSKRRSGEDANMSSDSGHSTNRSILSSAERRKHRDASQTTYQRPGPPTPVKNPLKEKNSILSITSSPKMTPKQTKQSAKTPNLLSRGTKLTPSALVRKVQAKIRSNKQTMGENTTPRSSNMKLNVFRKPLGSRGSSSDAKL